MDKNIRNRHIFTKEERCKGGKKSVEVRRKKTEFKEEILTLLNDEIDCDDGVKRTGTAAIAYKLFLQALDGDKKAFELIRDTSGQKPVEKVITSDISQDVFDEVESILAEFDKEYEREERESNDEKVSSD